MSVNISGGSRISRLGERRPVGGGTNLRRVHFLAKTYAKTKEIDPVGGRPPGSANEYCRLKTFAVFILIFFKKISLILSKYQLCGQTELP